MRQPPDTATAGTAPARAASTNLSEALAAPMCPTRRQWLGQAARLGGASALAGSGLLGLTACERGVPPLPDVPGGFTGIAMNRGHAMRDQLRQAAQAPDRQQRAKVVIAGGGMAGLAAARALRLAGESDFALFELEDQAGGNSRAGSLGGLPCPLGAHYLPLPGDAAPEVQDWLEELGLRQRVAGRWQYDERHLCHSPQERVFVHGQWQEGLLPVDDMSEATLGQYRRFSLVLSELAQQSPFSMPAMSGWRAGQPLPAVHAGLDAQTFAHWLDAQGFTDPWLRWYLDYACRDDFGAGSARVSAWAGVHYFASRHGFHAPGDASDEAGEAVLTWPEGNGWLSQRLAQPLIEQGQLHTASSVLRIAPERHGVAVDVLDHASGAITRWQCERCIVALPVFIAQRVLQPAPAVLQAVAAKLDWAPWLVSNLHLSGPLHDNGGAPLAWDNVIQDDQTPGALGYVDAGHQRLNTVTPQPTVLTYYQALGDLPDARRQLAERPWQHWRDLVLHALRRPHPYLPERVTRMALTRYGHAMAIPQPHQLALLHAAATAGDDSARSRVRVAGERSRPLGVVHDERIAFAHSDWAGYSVLEEAFTRGHHAGLWAAG